MTLEGALALLCEIDPNGARVVELKFFGGLGNDEVAAIEGVSTRTVERNWRASRAWLRDRVTRSGAE